MYVILAAWQGAEYQEWLRGAAHWVRPYAVFCVLRDLFGTSEHWRWGALSKPTPEVPASSPLPWCRCSQALT